MFSLTKLQSKRNVTLVRSCTGTISDTVKKAEQSVNYIEQEELLLSFEV
jgi:hypothetical protein